MTDTNDDMNSGNAGRGLAIGLLLSLLCWVAFYRLAAWLNS